ncbi:MAG: ATP-grasp fold amidoligase family protein [bacterium]|nr:ATP-grasp fold amidoligase family protein [bacterium]
MLLFETLGHRGLFNWMPDERYLKVLYYIRMGKKIDLKEPKTFSEKLQWIKLYDRNPLYTQLVDKYKVRNYVEKRIGKQYLIPLIGGPWECFDEIDFSKLPDKFVLKCTHDSGGLIICKDKSKLDLRIARRKIERCLKHCFYDGQREWPYKNVKPRIIAEEYKEDSKDEELRDYKFFSFDGEPKALFIATERGDDNSETKFDFFDMDYNHLPFTNGHPNAKEMPRKPECFDEMKVLASKLSQKFPEVRVDFYEVDGRVFFGEMTFFHWSGLMPFNPEKWDTIFGQWIKLPKD